MKLRNKSSDKKDKQSLPKVQKTIKKIVQKKSTYKKQKEQTNPLKRTKTIAASIKESEEFLKRGKQKDQGKSSQLKRTRTIAASIKESDDYLKRQDKIQKEQNKKNLKSPKKSKSPVPEKKIKKSPKPSKSSKKSVSKSKSVDKKQEKKKPSKAIKKEEKVEKKKSVSKKEEKKEEKKPQKEKKGKDKKELPKPSHPKVMVRQPSKLPDDSKPTNALKRQESKLGQPGFPTAGIIDAVFCMDTTGSMGSYLAQSKKVIEEIIKKIDDKIKGTKIDVKFGFVAYRDHPPQDSTYVTKFNNLDNEDNIKKFISKLDTIPGGGGDFPEAVMDGLMDAAKLTKWRDSPEFPQLRYIFHICDAPPHGQAEFGSPSSEWSSGCPCGITTNDITHQINLHQIHYRLIKIGGSLEQMSKVFKEKFTNFDEQAIESAKDLDIHVTDMIMRELLPDFD